MGKLFYLSAALLLLLSSCKTKQEKIQPTFEDITESVYASGIVKNNKHDNSFAEKTNWIIEMEDGKIIRH